MDGSFKTQARRLTKFNVEAARPRGERFEMSDGGSPLRLVVFPSGAKSWVVRFRVSNRTRKLTVGPYPALSLADARVAAAKAMTDVAQGSDPAEAKRRQRERQSETIRAAVPEYVRRYQKPRNKTAAEVEAVLTRVLVGPLGSREVRDITRRDLKRVLDGANRNTIAKVKHFFKWCTQQDMIEHSPADALTADEPVTSRERILTDDELRAFFDALPHVGEPWASFYELLAITAQRRSEVSEAPRGEHELDTATWTIASGRAKNGKAHVVHLVARAVEIVRAQGGNDPDGFVFPAANGGEGAISGFSKAKARLDRHMLRALQTAAKDRGEDPKKVKLAHWVIHDLRRTAATKMAALGFPIHVVERVLNHVAGSTTGGLVAVYQRHEYLAERRAALEAWAEYLQGLKT